MELNVRLNKSGGEFDIDMLANTFDIHNLKEWGFADLELGFNIDKIEKEKEDKSIITIKEKDNKKANDLFNELKKRKFKVKIK